MFVRNNLKKALFFVHNQNRVVGGTGNNVEVDGDKYEGIKQRSIPASTIKDALWKFRNKNAPVCLNYCADRESNSLANSISLELGKRDTLMYTRL